LIFLLVNQGERQPLLSESISQNPTVLDHLSIPTPDERHQSFYSATHSIDGTLRDGSRHTRPTFFFPSIRKKRTKERYRLLLITIIEQMELATEI
jgi:hypothetical protein